MFAYYPETLGCTLFVGIKKFLLKMIFVPEIYLVSYLCSATGARHLENTIPTSFPMRSPVVLAGAGRRRKSHTEKKPGVK